MSEPTVIGKCDECKEDYDPESFRVKVQGTGPYWSFICQKCATKAGAEIIKVDKTK